MWKSHFQLDKNNGRPALISSPSHKKTPNVRKFHENTKNHLLHFHFCHLCFCFTAAARVWLELRAKKNLFVSLFLVYFVAIPPRSEFNKIIIQTLERHSYLRWLCENRNFGVGIFLQLSSSSLSCLPHNQHLSLHCRKILRAFSHFLNHLSAPVIVVRRQQHSQLFVMNRKSSQSVPPPQHPSNRSRWESFSFF